MISCGITSVGRVSAGQVGSIDSRSPWSLPGLCLCPALPLACPTSPYWRDSWLDFGPDSSLRTFWAPQDCGPTLVAATRLAVCALGPPWTTPLVVRVVSPLGASGAALSCSSLTSSVLHPGYCPPAAVLGNRELTAAQSTLLDTSSLKTAVSIGIEQQHCSCIIHWLLLKKCSSGRLEKI